MTAADIMKEMPSRFNADKAKNMDATVQFDISGDDGGQWYAIIKDGDLDLQEGSASNPKATMIMSDADFVALSTGKLNGMAAFMSGKVKVEGDLNTIMKLQGVLGL